MHSITNTRQFIQKFLQGIGAILTLAFIIAGLTINAQASKKVIHSFVETDGGYPTGNLISDASGNVYGVTFGGGVLKKSCDYPYLTGCGTVFELSPAFGGGWKRTVLYEFKGGADGANPTAGLVMDGAGNLYGTTSNGGYFGNIYGYGVVFELSPTSSGAWKETVLYTFHYTGDGDGPSGTLILDAGGNLYGTTYFSNPQSEGVAFELSPALNGMWNETILHTFTGKADGGNPDGGLIFDPAGNLYGTASAGGTSQCRSINGNGCGVVFKLSPKSSGGWTETVINTFSGNGGSWPIGNLALDASGNLYGVTQFGGQFTGCNYGCGVVYELSSNAQGWSQTVLHTFGFGSNGVAPGGVFPHAGPTLDVSGNLYGTAFNGGLDSDGVLFKLSRDSNGSWNEEVLHSFTGGADGAFPQSGVLFDAASNLYGTAYTGGLRDCPYNSGCGVVFEITP